MVEIWMYWINTTEETKLEFFMKSQRQALTSTQIKILESECSSDLSEEQDTQNERFYFNSRDSTVQQVIVPLFSHWDGKIREIQSFPKS